MGTRHRILEDFYDEWFMLIALRSNLEDYSMAFALNSVLQTGFKRGKNDVDINKSFSIPVFEWLDEKTESNWFLFPNGVFGVGNANLTGLFKDMPSSAKHHVVPEHKEVDYFIKVDQKVSEVLIKRIQEVPAVVTAYAVDCEKLNSKNNLIF